MSSASKKPRILSVAECRELLGAEAVRLSDREVIRLRNSVARLARVTVRTVRSSRKREPLPS